MPSTPSGPSWPRGPRSSLVALGVALSACGGPDAMPEGDPGPDPGRWTPRPAGALWPDEAGEPLPIPPALAAHAWLGDVSHYGQRGPHPGRGLAGSLGLGNGEVFALVGLDAPVNTLTNVLGPGYQRSGAFFGDAWLELVRGGVPLAVDEERLQRPRRSAVARTAVLAEGLRLETLDVAPPGERRILRHVTVTNVAGDGAALALRLSLARAADEVAPAHATGLLQQRGRRQQLIHCPGQAVTVGASELTLPLAPLAPGESVSFACAWEFATDAAPTPAPIDLDAALAAHGSALGAYLDAGSVRLELPDPKVADLLEGLLVTLYTQTAPSGVVSQMHRYTSGWLRDTEGAVRLWLALGHVERARRLLDAVAGSLTARGAIANSFSLELDADTPPPADPRAFWASAPFMEGRGAAESPSYLPFLHRQVVDTTGDTAWVDGARLALLEACVLRQEVDAEGLLPFSGDETFHIAMGQAVLGLPASISGFGASLHSAGLYLAATDAVRQLHAAGGGALPLDTAALDERRARVARALDERFWDAAAGLFHPVVFSDATRAPFAHPYEDASLSATWFGWLATTDPRRSSNLEAVARELLRDDGTLQSPGALGFTGMVPGQWLHAAAALERPEADAAFAALDAIATPSGHFEELHAPGGGVLAFQHVPDGSGSDLAARYRSWEGGDVGAALVSYLTGYTPDATASRLTLAPRVPPGWPGFRLRGLPFRGGTVDLAVTAYEEGLVVELATAQEAPVEVALRLPGALWVAGSKVGDGAAALVLEPGVPVTVVAGP